MGISRIEGFLNGQLGKLSANAELNCANYRGQIGKGDVGANSEFSALCGIPGVCYAKYFATRFRSGHIQNSRYA